MTNKLSEAIRILSQTSAPNVSDAMGKLLSKNLKHQTMDAGINAVDRSMKVCGPAFTVRCYPGATYAMEKAIVEAPKGSVIVCDGQGSDAGVLMGGLMSTAAMTQGVIGAVIDGATRDIDDIIELKFPMFSRHIVARSGTFAQLGDLQCQICCGGVVVNPDDIIVADCNGVAVVPNEIAMQVATASSELSQWEENVRLEILKGKSLDQAASMFEKPGIQKI